MEPRKEEHVTGRDGLIAGAVEVKFNVPCKEKRSCILLNKKENTVGMEFNLSSHKKIN